MTPIYQITIDGNPVNLCGRLISLTLNDKNGMTADMLTIAIDDADGSVDIPRKGVHLTASFGFIGGLQNVGEYVVDEVNHDGPPDVLTIRASSADFRETLLQERETSYHDTTLGAIIETIAARNSLKPAIADEYKSITIPHLDQTNESDANLITRLAEQYGAVGTVKSGRLVFIERGAGKTASGSELPTLTIQRHETTTHSYRESDREARITGVTAYWQDKPKAKRKKVEVGQEGYRRHLKPTFHSEAEAHKAAEAEFKRLQTRARTLEVTLAIGHPEAIAEQPITVVGYKPQIDAIQWFATEITHTLNDGGLATSIQCEELQK